MNLFDNTSFRVRLPLAALYEYEKTFLPSRQYTVQNDSIINFHFYIDNMKVTSGLPVYCINNVFLFAISCMYWLLFIVNQRCILFVRTIYCFLAVILNMNWFWRWIKLGQDSTILTLEWNTVSHQHTGSCDLLCRYTRPIAQMRF